MAHVRLTLVPAAFSYRSVGLILAASIAAACSDTYAFVPARNATSTIYGHAAAEYPIPPQSPHGEVRVASYGIEQLAPGNASDQSLGALHIREGVVAETTPFARVETDSDSPYTYDYSAPQQDYDPSAYGYDYWDAPFLYNSGYVGFYGGVDGHGGRR
jgi:hypothetical protein